MYTFNIEAVLFVFILYINIAQFIDYKWIRNDDRWDCVVGISWMGKIPLSTGIIFTKKNLVLTTATPVENYNTGDLKVHVINGAHDKSTQYDVKCKMTPYFWKRKKTWIKVGLDGKHSPVHDVITLHIDNTNLSDFLYGENSVPRMPFRTAYINTITKIKYNSGNLRFGGFGYIDEQHIKDNSEFEMESYPDPVIENCDEWIPRDWGHMICIKNKDFLLGVATGSPLFQDDLILGLGLFEVTKGNESIFVFTDLRPYFNFWWYCLG